MTTNHPSPPPFRIKVEQYLSDSEVARTVADIVVATYPKKDIENETLYKRRCVSVEQYLQARRKAGLLFCKKDTKGTVYWSNNQSKLDLTCSVKFRTPLKDLFKGLPVTNKPHKFFRGWPSHEH
jgi:hypothetical protein